MKKILFALLVLPLKGFNQILVIAEEQNYLSKNMYQPGGYVWVNTYLKSRTRTTLGVFGYTFVQPNTTKQGGWYEFYGGPTVTVTSKKNPQRYVEMGLAIGKEKDYAKNWRKSLYILYTSNPDTTGKDAKGKIQLLGMLEKGGSGYWGLVSAVYNVTNHLSIGGIYQGYAGVLGPRIGITFGNFECYTALGKNLTYKEFGSLTGINYTFQ